MIKFKRSTQSVEPQTQIESPISDVSAMESPKKKRVIKRLKPVMPDAGLLASEDKLRICHMLALFELTESGLWRRINAGYFPRPLKDTRPYWPAPVIREYMTRPPEDHVRAFYEDLIEKHPERQAIHRASMRAAIRNVTRARAEAQQKKRQAAADAEYNAAQVVGQ
jgi:predicted DNA-binding transcriptional regulator AlpA